MKLHSVLALGLLSSLTQAASTFKPVRPPSLPLAVKSPYLSAWLPAGSANPKSGQLPGQWPVFWAGQILGWAGMVRVDGEAYTWMGEAVTQTALAPTYAEQISAEYTSTKTVFVLHAGAVELTVTFLSPLTPKDFQRQSLIFSYVNVNAKSLDGKAHSVQVYSDISGEWSSGDRSQVVQWEYADADTVSFHRVHRQVQAAFSENRDQAEWGNVYWATSKSNGTTHFSGSDRDSRSAFAKNGVLANTKDDRYRAISNEWPVFAFAKDLGSVTSGSDALFVVGLAQNQAVQFSGRSNFAPVASLWTSYFGSEEEALEFFYNDFGESSKLSAQFDSDVARDSIAAAGQDYLTITSLAARQAFGATQLGGTKDKQYLFLKEISSNGNMQTIDVIFPAWPIFLYTNPVLIKLLLDPHFEYQESGKYPNKWAIHDLGTHFPNATGHDDGQDEPMPLEECGNNLIMVLSYVQQSNDVQWLRDHYPLLKQWAGFLVDEALLPGEQLSTDDFAGRLVNQTNLALKGMIGIQAMSDIASRTGNTADKDYFGNIAKDYIEKWQELGINKNDNPPHTTLNYNDKSSHGLLYNIFADKQLGLNLVPQSVYDMQSKFYPTQATKYGVPLDTRHKWTKGDWEIFAAAAASTETRDMFIKQFVTWMQESPSQRPLTDLYETDNGDHPGGITFTARPVVGGTFALLILPKSTTPITGRDETTKPSPVPVPIPVPNLPGGEDEGQHNAAGSIRASSASTFGLLVTSLMIVAASFITL